MLQWQRLAKTYVGKVGPRLSVLACECSLLDWLYFIRINMGDHYAFPFGKILVAFNWLTGLGSGEKVKKVW